MLDPSVVIQPLLAVRFSRVPHGAGAPGSVSEPGSWVRVPHPSLSKGADFDFRPSATSIKGAL